MFSIHDTVKLKEFLEEIWEKSFRYGQIENAIYKNFVTDFDDIQTIPQALRDKLKENFHYTTLTVDHKATSKNDQTTKLLFKTADDLFYAVNRICNAIGKYLFLNYSIPQF